MKNVSLSIYKQRQRGFSLLELLMVLGVIAILAVFAIPNENTRQKQKFTNSYNNIISSLIIARDHAITKSKTFSAFIGSDSLGAKIVVYASPIATNTCSSSGTWNKISEIKLELPVNYGIYLNDLQIDTQALNDASGNNQICYYMDGSSSGGEIKLQLNNNLSGKNLGTATINIVPATGYNDISVAP